MTASNSSEFDIPKINLKTYNNILKKSICLAKKIYYETLFQKFKDDIKGTWKTINGILNKTKRKRNCPRFFRDGDKILDDKRVITNKLNKYFANVHFNL